MRKRQVIFVFCFALFLLVAFFLAKGIKQAEQRQRGRKRKREREREKGRERSRESAAIECFARLPAAAIN